MPIEDVLHPSGNSVMSVQLVEQRRAQLLELVRQRRFASLPDLVKALDVSESTVRRDLEVLEEQAAVRRIHGGALYRGTSPKIPHFEASQSAAWREKQAIARRAVEFVDDGDSLLLDGGSTTFEVARLLVGRPLHVVTNSLPVANLFAADTNSDLVLLGGDVCPRSGAARGPYTDRMLSSLRVRRTILSVAGISDEGFFNNNLLLIETERGMMRAADEVTIVADHSKFGRQSLGHLCPLDGVTRVISDDGLASAWREKLPVAGIELVVASTTAEPIEGN